ncbi:BnaCnng28530D [Brassica napus]|uniref:BnaCnng28530D protein n=1 Tax=Brassica napus TaxID=3708 RepID=A0A078IUW4_BRANA|nr:BnaCnng28530D [Brassica napus]
MSLVWESPQTPSPRHRRRNLQRTLLNSHRPEIASYSSQTEFRDLLSVADVCQKLENVKIVCSVEAVDTDWAWYYFGCKGCGKIVTRIRRSVSGKLTKPLFCCAGCRTNGSNVVPKFKLHLIVHDDTGDCKLVLLGSIAKSIIGFEAQELWDGSYEEIEDPENLPQPILDLVGKSFCFGLCPSDSGSEIYKVSKVWSGDIIHQIETESEPVTLIEGCSSTVSSGGVMLQDVENHASSGDCATPFSKRKETDSELADITSTSKKLVYQTIGSSPSTTTFDPLHAAQGSSSASPHTPSTAPVRLFGVDLTLNQPSCSTVHRSCLTNANLSFRPNCTRSKTLLSQNRKRRRKPPRSVLDDITNISHSLSNGNEETTTNIHRDINQEDDELLDDDFVGGISHYEGELDFDFSSQESSDSELEADNVEVHATPATDQIRQVHATPATDPLNRRRNASKPTFSLCCLQGQVQLPLLKEPPLVLKKLMEGDDILSKHFQKNMRPYNMAFSFTPLGGKVERSVEKGIGPSMFQLQGENYHLMGSLQPNDGNEAKFGQLYIVDTEHEVENRVNCLR